MKLFDDLHSSWEAVFDQPLLDFVRFQKAGRPPPPYFPKWSVMPLHRLCKLALIWHELGFQKEAGGLASWLFKLSRFRSLWCPDREYDEAEASESFSLLEQIEPTAPDPLSCDLTLFENGRIAGALTLDGNGTSLGAIHANGIEIRAFGPQDGSFKFGIKGKSLDEWTPTFASSEIWLHMKHEAADEECRLDFRFVGLQVETPLSLAFYIKGENSQIGSELFKPKSLKRFYGEARSIVFGDRLKIESQELHKVQLIPLAGQGCFWNCDFMVCFELHPFSNQPSFNIKCNF